MDLQQEVIDEVKREKDPRVRLLLLILLLVISGVVSYALFRQKISDSKEDKSSKATEELIRSLILRDQAKDQIILRKDSIIAQCVDDRLRHQLKDNEDDEKSIHRLDSMLNVLNKLRK